MDLTVRPATHDDYEAVAAFTTDTWADRDSGDYIPGVYHDWIDKPGSRTLVADAGDELAGIAQAVLVSDHEAWCQGMRVNPAYRGRGVSTLVDDALFEWAAERGAVVARNMVFSWNVPALGASRAAGYEPATEFRWAHVDPGPAADPGDADVVADPDAAWAHWTDSAAREHLRGLALSPSESWALCELTREHLRRAADETAVLAVRDGGTRAATFRTRDYEREADDGTVETWAEYGATAWSDVEAARALFAGVARDAASLGADRTRVLVPETPRHVTDAAYVRAGLSEEPDFVFSADLTAGSWRDR